MTKKLTDVSLENAFNTKKFHVKLLRKLLFLAWVNLTRLGSNATTTRYRKRLHRKSLENLKKHF